MRRVAPRFGAPVRPLRVDFSALAATKSADKEPTKPLATSGHEGLRGKKTDS